MWKTLQTWGSLAWRPIPGIKEFTHIHEWKVKWPIHESWPPYSFGYNLLVKPCCYTHGLDCEKVVCHWTKSSFQCLLPLLAPVNSPNVHQYISMAQCKIAVTTLLTHWSYCSLALSHRYISKAQPCDVFVNMTSITSLSCYFPTYVVCLMRLCVWFRMNDTFV